MSSAEFLTRAGLGTLGIVDYDNVELSNIHRQSLYDYNDINKSKVRSCQKKIKKIKSKTKVNCYKIRLNKRQL